MPHYSGPERERKRRGDKRPAARGMRTKETSVPGKIFRKAGKLQSAGQAGAAGAIFGTQAGAAADFTRLFIVLAATHFLLDAAAFNQLAETADRFLNALAVADDQLNHWASEKVT
jgi:hypothetical protein